MPVSASGRSGVRVRDAKAARRYQRAAGQEPAARKARAKPTAAAANASVQDGMRRELEAARAFVALVDRELVIQRMGFPVRPMLQRARQAVADASCGEADVDSGPVTHWDGCWETDPRRHGACAVAEVARLRRRLADVEAERDDLRAGMTGYLARLRAGGENDGRTEALSGEGGGSGRARAAAPGRARAAKR